MKRPLRIAALALMLLGAASAQDVRSLGMGGLTLPGPAATGRNPAYAAYDARRFGGGGFTLPLGLVNLALRPSISPLYYFRDPSVFRNHFDLLAFYDQLTHLDEFVINPPASPREIVFHVSADGVTVTDGDGNPFDLNRFSAQTPPPSGSLPPPLLELNLPSGVPGLRLAVGAFLQSGGFGLTPDDALVRDLASGSLQPNTTYHLTATGTVKGGITSTLGYAAPLPALPGFDGRVYLGGQIQAFYGMLYVDTTVTGQTTTDGSGNPGPLGYVTDMFYVVPGNGQGYGAQLDFGVVLDYEAGSYGLGVKNLVGLQRWNGHRMLTDASGSVVSDTAQNVSEGGFRPSIFANAAYLQPLEGAAGDLLLGADLGYAPGAPSGHLGVEYRLAALRLRGGLGYEQGFKLGLGAGLEFSGLRTDLALTSHTAPFTGQMVYGVAASLGLAF